MTMDEFMAELGRTEQMKKGDVYMMMVMDPEKLYRTFLRVKSTLEPEAEVVEMQEELETSIEKMREDQKSIAEYCAMESFPDSYAVIRSIKRAMEGSTLSLDELYGEESSRTIDEEADDDGYEEDEE